MDPITTEGTYTEATALYADCESPYSNVLCAIPNNQGQARAGVDRLITGSVTGNGKNKQFQATTTFSAGDQVIFRAHVVDNSTGLPVAGATVDLAIAGPEATTLTTGLSDADGVAEATWNTQPANKRGQGGTTPGSYTATVTNVAAGGYSWDGVETSASFTIQ